MQVQPVAGAADGADGHVRAELVFELGDEVVDGVIVDRDTVAPYCAQDLLAGDRATRVLQQEAEQIELGTGEGDACAAVGEDFAGSQVDAVVSGVTAAAEKFSAALILRWRS